MVESRGFLNVHQIGHSITLLFSSPSITSPKSVRGRFHSRHFDFVLVGKAQVFLRIFMVALFKHSVTVGQELNGKWSHCKFY